ncbi:MAG: two-component sensor histidine kinase, partial [Neglectibacter timonensis]
MRRKISQSIQAKTFLSMLALLVVCCILIYGMVMIFLPRNYHTELEGQVTSDFYDLMAVLEQNGWEASSDSLMEFSMTNNASVEVNDNYGNNLFSVNFADMENLDTSAPSMSCSATFQQGGQTYHVFANAALVAVAQSYDILLKLIPFITVVILLISVIGAVVCSRYYSKPLV